MKNNKKNHLCYFNELRDQNDYIYSIDNLRIEFSIDSYCEDLFLKYFSCFGRTDITHYDNFKFHNYRHLWTIAYDEKSSMTVGFSLNGADYHSDKLSGYIDVNPNKVGSFKQFWKDYNFIHNFSKYFNVKRCDIALDLPIKREYLSLIKNNKKYEQISRSHSNRTEYLGRRSNIGFVKVYNKSMQSKLDYDLTRIEITCLLSTESYKQYFPEIYDISRKGMFEEELDSLNDTEKAIVIMQNKLMHIGDDDAFMIFSSMGRAMKKKLKKFIVAEECKISYSDNVLEELINSAHSLYIDFPNYDEDISEDSAEDSDSIYEF
ncbi:MAG: hypothetical protein IKE52_03445 [Mogibacterium sp.]|nr:hypothetical protein [Mogibacterium sp.]